jgi:hypothetical protein
MELFCLDKMANWTWIELINKLGSGFNRQAASVEDD